MTPTAAASTPHESTAVVPATERALESAVDLARAETKLALLHAKTLSVRAVKVIATTLMAGFLFQVGIALLVLVPLRGTAGNNPVISIVVAATLLASLVCGGLALRGLDQLARGS